MSSLQRLLVAVLSGAVVVAAIALATLLVAGRGDDVDTATATSAPVSADPDGGTTDGTTITEEPDGEPATAAGGDDVLASEQEPPELPTTAPDPTSTPRPTPSPTPAPVAQDVSRTATFIGEGVNIRDRPDLDRSRVCDFRTGRNSAIVVVGTITVDGWYQVRTNSGDCPGSTGWMFGAFITPPDRGFVVAENVRGFGVPLSIQDQNGRTVTNATGGALLLLDAPPGADRWPVQLADGEVGLVDASLVRVVAR